MANFRKNLNFCAVFLDGRRVRRSYRCPAGQFLTSDGIEKVLAAETKLLEEHFPGRGFRLVPMAGGDFNFVEMSKEEAELREKRSELREQYSERAAV